MEPDGYTAKQLAQLLSTSVDRIRAYARDGFVEPAKGERGEYRFSFQEVVLLRTAEGLAKQLPPAKVRRALRRLKQQLPNGRALANLKIAAEGDDVVLRDGGASFHAESGQGLLNFETSELADRVRPLAAAMGQAARQSSEQRSAEQWFELGVELESCSTGEALEAYRKAVTANAEHTHALINLGRLLHEQGDTREAADLYMQALETNPEDPTALFNLGVALEDLGRLNYARRCYEHALQMDPANADAHFNASRLCERLGDQTAAMRHLMSYRALTREA